MKRSLVVAVLIFTQYLLYGQKPVDYVNPFIGTTNYGATNPGAVAPWGMASVVPFNVAGEGNKLEKDSQWLSTPYEVNNTRITGFSHVNLSGVGCPDLGSIILMPTTGDLSTSHKEYASEYSNEEASPGYYSVDLSRYNIKTEVSATQRSGISRYTFPAGKSNILLNLGLSLSNESGGMLNIVSPTEIEGFRMVGDFCYNAGGSRPVFFVVQFSKEPENFGVWKKNPLLGNVEKDWSKYSDKVRIYQQYRGSIAADSLGAYLSFNTVANEEITVRVGISYVSTENARQNLEMEQGGKSFDQVVQVTRSLWNYYLSRVTVEGGSDEQRKMFYTALYHVLLHPNVLQDVNGEYPKMESYEILKSDSDRFTTFSLWDTYRNVHPLLSLVYPEVQSQMVKSMLEIYKESGWLPKWELLSKETKTMVGDPATPVIVDTYMRGIRDFDIDLAFEAVRKGASTMTNNKLRPGNDVYIEKGYIPVGYDGVWGSLSTTQEYNIADWNVSVMAKELGKTEDSKTFLNRSLSYKKFYDPNLSILRPIGDDGWHEPFDPTYGKNFESVPGYVEGTAWQYTFFVPHDIPGLVKLYGGKRKFLKQLNRAFDENEFSMHNEPDIAYPYLYNYLKGEEWRTQDRVLACIEEYFSDQPDGLPGNDDTGTLSAWLVFSMMGLYPDCPGNPNYSITTPVFDKISIELNEKYYEGDKLNIIKRGEGNRISSVSWNSRKVSGYFVDHNQIVKGGNLVFTVKQD